MDKSDLLPQTEILEFCSRWRIAELALFGSALRDDFGPDSDLDMLVTFSPEANWGLLDHSLMKQELVASAFHICRCSVCLHHHVDFIPNRSAFP